MSPAAPPCRRSPRKPGFSLVELIIVVVIVGLLAAIAVPRFSRGAAGVNDAALERNLAVLRGALERYTAEHEGRPPDAARVWSQLTWASNAAGELSPTQTPTPEHPLGPYVQAMPALPVGVNRGNRAIHTGDAPGVGWIYDPDRRAIRANAAGETDAAGRDYGTY